MPQPAQSPYPPIEKDVSVQEGARWRHYRPSSESVAAWFASQPLDEGMEHRSYVGGVVLIPQFEKVKYPNANGSGTVERPEQVFTPYMQIGTRLAYFRRLAEHRDLIPVIRPQIVPRATNPASDFFNANMPDGLWWHVVNASGQGGPYKARYLCASYSAALYTPQGYADKLAGKNPLPMLEGTGTKQVSGGADANGLMKAQTGAIGRALGVAGILVVGTGIATAEDMQEFTSAAPVEAPAPVLPDPLPEGQQPQDAAQTVEGLRARALALSTHLQELDDEGLAWRTFTAWWQERSSSEGWDGLPSVPEESLPGLVSKLERDLDAGRRALDARNAVAPELT
jgi:hypothetical protein